jgi:EmrB/QacA subfamily drug resistance transporter
MSEAAPVHGRSKSLVLAAMIFAVAMTFIDQTIVSIAVPQIQTKLGLSATGVQWAVNAYLLALASLFAFGGRLADTLGHRRMVTWGVVVFAGASAMCGATPKGSLAEAWLIAFRALQGLGGAIMFPAALAIVVQTYDVRERGKALATFFGIAGALTAVGPIMGGFLTAWTWRAIFWVNLPIAAIAVLLIALSRPETDYRPARMDYRGLALITAGIVLGVFGFQQAPLWGWSNPAIGICIVAGLALLLVFYRIEVRTGSPLIDMAIFRNRTFLVENLVLGIAMLTFVPLFVFSSEYAQISLGKQAKDAGVFLLFFFVGFAVATQIGGRLLDKVGAKLPVTLGCALAAAGFFLWAGQVTSLDFGKQQWFIVMAGAGMGLMLSPASTDAVNQAGRFSYGEATGITQTIRNYAASLGLAVLGTTLVSRMRTNVANQMVAELHVPRAAADKAASSLAQMQNSGSGDSGGTTDLSRIPHFYQLAFAQSTETIFYAMGGVMAVAAIVAFLGLKTGVQHEFAESGAAEGLEATA